MIIWINGAWGSGKTTIATELNNRLENSLIFDPEEAGFYINKMIPDELKKNDFQDFAEWRKINNDLLKRLLEEYDGIIIVPMTIIEINYFREITQDISDGELHHYILEASEQTIHQRLTKRLEGKNSWARSRVSEAVLKLKQYKTARCIKSDKLSIEEIIKIIESESQLNLKEDQRGQFKKNIDRFLINLKEKIS